MCVLFHYPCGDQKSHKDSKPRKNDLMDVFLGPRTPSPIWSFIGLRFGVRDGTIINNVSEFLVLTGIVKQTCVCLTQSKCIISSNGTRIYRKKRAVYPHVFMIKGLAWMLL